MLEYKKVCRGCRVGRGELIRNYWSMSTFLGASGVLLLVIFLLGLLPVPALVDNDEPQRLQEEEIQFALVQSVSAQTAPAGQVPTCEQLLSQFQSDPRTQQASPAERQFVLAFLQAFAQGVLDEGAPGASQLDPDGNGIACDQLLSGGGGVGGGASPLAASAGSASAEPTV